jgi:hypothetical protein
MDTAPSEAGASPSATRKTSVCGATSSALSASELGFPSDGICSNSEVARFPSPGPRAVYAAKAKRPVTMVPAANFSMTRRMVAKEAAVVVGEEASAAFTTDSLTESRVESAPEARLGDSPSGSKIADSASRAGSLARSISRPRCSWTRTWPGLRPKR